MQLNPNLVQALAHLSTHEQQDAPRHGFSDMPADWMHQVVACLPAGTRLSLFRTCKELAYAVSTHAPSMRFKPGQHSTPAGHALNTSLIARSSCLHLWLKYPSHVQQYSQHAWHHLTLHSSLCKNGSVWQQLQQEKLKQVEALLIRDSFSYRSWQRISSCSEPAPRCLISLVNFADPYGTREQDADQVFRALPPAFCQQIKAVAVCGSLASHMQTFNALTHVELTGCTSFLKEGLRALLACDSITHVRVPTWACVLDEQSAQHTCNWQSLLLADDAYTLSYDRCNLLVGGGHLQGHLLPDMHSLPKGLQRLQIQHALSMSAHGNNAYSYRAYGAHHIRALQSIPQVEFLSSTWVPLLFTTRRGGWYAFDKHRIVSWPKFDGPHFSILSNLDDYYVYRSGDHMSLLEFCLPKLTGMLWFRGLTFDARTLKEIAMHTSLATHSMGFVQCEALTSDEYFDHIRCTWKHLFQALPPHTNHLVIAQEYWPKEPELRLGSCMCTSELLECILQAPSTLKTLTIIQGVHALEYMLSDAADMLHAAAQEQATLQIKLFIVKNVRFDDSLCVPI